jgi:O-antigen/teichoic acid export membrane protein
VTGPAGIVTTGRLLARNSALNLFGQALPILAAVLAIPPLMRGLGDERFGVLTLAWAAIGYFSLFELGLGKALTQAVALRLGNGDREGVAGLTWTALVLLVVFGVIGSIVFLAITPVLTTRILNIPPSLRPEAQLAFWILAAALPIVVITGGLRGLIEGHQHFGVATLLRVPMVVFTYLGPLLVLPFSRSLVPAVAVLAVGRIVALMAHLWVAARRYPFLRRPAAFGREPARFLLHFGGWSTVTNIVSPMMVYLDRFVIGAMLTVAAVAHYVIPYEVVVRLLIIPAALTGVMLPALASSIATNPMRMRELYDKSLRVVILATFPAVLVAVAFAREGLWLWMGQALPLDSAFVVQWLAFGVFATALAQAPATALQSAGRPDLMAKVHLAELPIYIVLLVTTTRAFGITGVAMAWTVRAMLDAVVLFWIAHRTIAIPLTPRLGGAWPVVVMTAALVAAAMLESTPARIAYVSIALVLFAPFGWHAMLHASERDGLRAWVRAPASVQPTAVDEPI